MKGAGRIGLGAFLVFALSFVTLLSHSQQVNADQCSINGRDCYFGYFFNGYDGGPPATGTRHNVISNPALLNVHNANELINTIGGHMNCSGGTLLNAGAQNATGSAFIILTMMGYAPGTSKNVACQVFGQWSERVIEWAPYTNYDNFYNFGGLNTRSTLTDVAYYPSAQTSAWSIVFYDQITGAPLYAIKKDCGNPVGHLQKLPDTPYTLTPHVDAVSPTNIEAGSKVSVNGSVDNEGARVSPATQWEITQITVKPGKKAPHEDENGTTSGTAPCQSNGGAASGDYFKNGDADCKNVAKGSGSFNLGAPAQNLKPSVAGLDVGDLPVGTRVCFALSVQPHSNTDANWAHSKPVCTVVGKKPKVQVWGGDVSVRGKIDTSTSVKDVSGTTKTFGSWVEYGAFSVGTNSRFASGSGTINQTSNDQAAWSNLTFANKNEVGTPAFGNYTTPAGFRPAPGVAAFFGAVQNKAPVGSGSIDISTLAFNTGDPVQVRIAGDLTITSSNIPAGKSVVIIATGTVTIDGNITYTDGALTKLRDIPQVVIIATNINIKDTVTHVDAWLVASGTVNTCSNFSGNLTSGKCNGLLELNGPIVTDKLVLNRTAGSDTGEQSGDPAERFNLRADAYLWAQLQSIGNNKAQTVYSVELPPRF
jgi:hypothetical protein